MSELYVFSSVQTYESEALWGMRLSNLLYIN